MTPSNPTEALAELDRLIHDAEQAEGGVEFMTTLHPDKAAAQRLARKAAVLRSRAAALAERWSIVLCQHGRIADECVDDPCYTDDEATNDHA